MPIADATIRLKRTLNLPDFSVLREMLAREPVVMADEITRRAGLPVTTVARTIADVIISGLDEEQVHRAIQEAIGRGLVTAKDLQDYAARRGGQVARVIHRALQQQSIL